MWIHNNRNDLVCSALEHCNQAHLYSPSIFKMAVLMQNYTVLFKILDLCKQFQMFGPYKIFMGFLIQENISPGTRMNKMIAE